MKVEHKLSPATAAYARRALEQLNEIRQKYLAALGAAKELEVAAEMTRQALSQQLALVEAAEGLPRSLTPYALSADGAALVGEVADAPAETEPAIAPPPHVNGAPAIEVERG